MRLDRLVAGNPGDVKPVGDGISELRIDYGPGYRFYYQQRGDVLIVLLHGGDKSSQSETSSGQENSQRSGPTMIKTEFTEYDSADYLTSLDRIAAYLEAVLEEAGDDPAFVAQALGTVARSQNFSQIAREVGMSREGLYKALSTDGNPSFATIMKVAKALGLKIEFHAVA
jgi:probable addiction module antidote protein